MNENTIQQNNEIEIDLGRICRAVMDRTWKVLIIAVISAAVAFAGTFFLITPQYEASAMFYVNNSAKENANGISSGDLSTARGLVDSYLVILNTRETINDVIDYSGVSRSYREVKDMISAGAVNSTEIIRVTVTSPDPNEAEKIANAIAYVMPLRITSIIEGSSTKVVDFAVVPTSPSSPSYLKSVVLGFLLGLILSVAVIVLREMFDPTIRNEDDVTQVCSLPILASVPELDAPGKGDSRYSHSADQSRRKKSGTYASGKNQPQRVELLGDGISFGASEAYKLLRTKVQFSFTDEQSCRIIGMSSALSGEGKSITSANLAYTLAQLNKKVILVDCDMRRPTLAEKLRIRKKPGLSCYLTGQCTLVDAIQQYSVGTNGNLFHVIAAGQNPPNPVELLSSAKMERMLEVLRKTYDYVILDLPPVGEVSDAMAVAKKIDGMLLVVRQNYCDRNVLADAIRQFSFINTRLLGVVFNCTNEHAGKHGRQYASHYENNDRSVADRSVKKA